MLSLHPSSDQTLAHLPGVRINHEKNGSTQQYTVRLNTQPTSKVTVVVESRDKGIALVNTNESDTFMTSVSLTFSSDDDWNTPQDVFVLGVDDRVDNPGGSRVVEITHTPSGGDYRTGDAKTLQAWVLNDSDNDAVGWRFLDSEEVTIADEDGVTIAGEDGVTIADEDGGTVAYAVELKSEPTSDVTVTVESDDPSAATVSPTSLTFTPDEWDTPQTVTVTGVNDNLDNPPVGDADDGRLARIIHTPNGGGYDYIEPLSIEVTVQDNDGGDDAVEPTPGTKKDTVGLTLTPSTTGDDEPLEVDDEDGGRATYTIRLNTEPTDVVTVYAESQDTSISTVSPLLLTFTRTNWDKPQTVTVAGVNDDVDNTDDMRPVSITHASSGGDYDSVDFVDEDDTPSLMVNVNVLDDDIAGLRLSSEVIRPRRERDQDLYGQAGNGAYKQRDGGA